MFTDGKGRSSPTLEARHLAAGLIRAWSTGRTLTNGYPPDEHMGRRHHGPRYKPIPLGVRWGQRPDQLSEEALGSPHPRMAARMQITPHVLKSELSLALGSRS
ncbi:hypothetical protein RB195_004032 [Necator americanus]|uniref:Uncharacterized protein n=1 Tax=Necator americanus TaxID=51031 RepID=A0ABR1BG86_NECAM